MNQLELVWELERHNTIIEESKKNLNELENSIKLKNMTTKINELEVNASQIMERKIYNNKQISKLERMLKEYDYTKNKLESNLYNGSITDLKQLEHLTREKDAVLSKIDEIEFDILEKMDENEALQKENNSLKDELYKLNLEILDISNIIHKEIKQLQIRIQNAEHERSNILPNIDGEILNKYEKIRTKRGKGIVHINDRICVGCNMRIPTYLLKDLKKGDEIIYCESCGRILYYMKQDDSSIS